MHLQVDKLRTVREYDKLAWRPSRVHQHACHSLNMCLQVEKLRTVRKRKGLEGDEHDLPLKPEGAATPAGSKGTGREEVEVIDPSPTGRDACICAQLGISTSQLQALVAHCIERLESKRMDPGGHQFVHALRQAAAGASRPMASCASTSMTCRLATLLQPCRPAADIACLHGIRWWRH